ncbi:hypothetical protein TI39_contig4340g00001 [Zymoseptoria brevis]|uniref:Uncharacterized protein n=1 Tax=Zymoseptoria brevis TaxID=1047168 RepID=A0A0F4G7D9_9PEZI|nr:hypothetical protein TI39_contig4340g00001 [Zymoseptoria brevis]
MQSFFNLLLAVLAVLAAATIDRRQTAETVADSWIVRVDDDSALSAVLAAVRTASGAEAKHSYSIGSFKGFAFDGDDELVSLIANLASIHSIEPDTKVHASAPIINQRALVEQSPAEYGLVRISRRTTGGSTSTYDDSAGAGSTVYVIDTGVNTAHEDFGGRAVVGASFVLLEPKADFNGHGTHCSSIVAGSTYGVVKKANIIGVKVLGALGTGLNSGVLAGIDWAINDAQQKG